VHRCFLCDVFTDRRFGGNPLAVRIAGDCVLVAEGLIDAGP